MSACFLRSNVLYAKISICSPFALIYIKEEITKIFVTCHFPFSAHWPLNNHLDIPQHPSDHITHYNTWPSVQQHPRSPASIMVARFFFALLCFSLLYSQIKYHSSINHRHPYSFRFESLVLLFSSCLLF